MKTAAGATTEAGKPRRPGAWLFLAGVLLAWLAAAVLAPARIGPALDMFRQLLGEVLPTAMPLALASSSSSVSALVMACGDGSASITTLARLACRLADFAGCSVAESAREPSSRNMSPRFFNSVKNGFRGFGMERKRPPM